MATNSIQFGVRRAGYAADCYDDCLAKYTERRDPEMQVYDIIMLIVLVSATLFGAWKGLAWQLASLGAIFLSYYVSVEFRDEVASYIDATPPWNVFLAMLILYVATSFVIWLTFRFVSDIIDKVRLKEFDRQIGALFGFAKGVLLCIIITLFAVTLLGEEQRATIINSRSGNYIALLLDRAHGVMPSEIHEVLHPYMHPLESHETHKQLHSGEPSDTANQPPSLDQLIPVEELFHALERGTPIPVGR